MIGDLLLGASIRVAAATPSPTPAPGAPKDDQVTPGYVGFIVTFLLAVVVVLLVIDMVRRIRRVRYRAEIAEKLDAEQQLRRGDEPGADDPGAGTDDGDADGPRRTGGTGGRPKA
ncbi:hypothetical protein ACFVWR_15115 [Leifsonia sp. NPDC058292]|uniref:hypothetical protein n=1 Tax=Leifsonia sp. NPDC058292 TaxID=3346428 RepID=UPI0036D933E1